MRKSAHIYGTTDKGNKWQQMKLIYDCCIENNIKVPEEVLDRFYARTTEEQSIPLNEALCEVTCRQDIEAYVIDLAKLPKNVTHVRVLVTKFGGTKDEL